MQQLREKPGDQSVIEKLDLYVRRARGTESCQNRCSSCHSRQVPVSLAFRN